MFSFLCQPVPDLHFVQKLNARAQAVHAFTSFLKPNNTGEYVSFQRTNKLELGHRVDCTGVLVSTKYIMTSDHCVTQATQNERIELIAGSGHSQNSQIRQAKKVWPLQKPKSYIRQDHSV